jgi:hypothetical protein
MIIAEIEFNILLQAIKTYLDRPPDPDNPTPDTIKDVYGPNQIKVMESGIFYKGGLKGKALTLAGKRSYKVWPILDLKELTVKLGLAMTMKEDMATQAVVDTVSGYFDNLLNALAQAAPLARLGKVRQEAIKQTKAVIEGWKDKTIKNIQIPSQMKQPDIIAGILIVHLPPGIPDLTIAARVNDLLGAFGLEKVETDTLRRKIAKLR